MKTPDKTIDEAIDDLRTAVQDHVDKMFKTDPRIILGVNSGPLQSTLESIEQGFQTANELLELYCSFFKGKIRSYDLFVSEILPMISMNDSQADTHVKLIFVDFNSIAIPDFPRFSKSKIVQSIDYTLQEMTFFSTLRDLLLQLRDFTVEKYLRKDLFDTKTGSFNITNNLRDQLTEKFTKTMSADQISEFVLLTFIAVGLNGFNEIGNGRSMDSAVQGQSLDTLLLSIRRNLKYSEDGIDIDSEKLKQRYGFDEAVAKIHIRLKSKREPEVV